MPNQNDYKYQFVYLQKPLFYRIKLFFSSSLLQKTKLDPKYRRTLQRPWTNWRAPTMRTLASVKRDLDDFLGPK